MMNEIPTVTFRREYSAVEITRCWHLPSRRLVQQKCVFQFERYRQSRSPEARRLGGANEASVRPRCVDPPCTRIVPRSPPAAVRV